MDMVVLLPGSSIYLTINPKAFLNNALTSQIYQVLWDVS